jgi:AraC-like DNA-binding protein
MMEFIATALIGFSLVGAFLLAVAYRTIYLEVAQTRRSRFSGYAMLLGFVLLQAMHWRYLVRNTDLFSDYGYIALLFANAALLYWFFLGLLRPATAAAGILERYLPLVSFAVAPLTCWVASTRVVPGKLAVPLAFVFGALYAAHLAYLVFQLRAQRRWFRLEFGVFMAFAAISVGVLFAGLAAHWTGTRIFVLSYSTLIGISFAIMVYLLLRFPDVLNKTVDAVSVAYAVSTLGKLDQALLLQALRDLLERERIFEDDSLSLAKLARKLSLSTHQLSELINANFGISFSALIRQHRVEAAKKMLLDEPLASVLSVGMAVGFCTQSNFYAAFKEITGQVPGQFRKHGSTKTESGAQNGS